MVERTTRSRLYEYSYLQAQDGSPIMVLTPALEWLTDFAAALARAKARLDTLDWYPEPVRIERVRVFVAPWFFRSPRLPPLHGYAFWRTILLKHATFRTTSITHELCHIWQGQHRALHMAWKHVTTRYRSNPYEIQARRAVAETKRSSQLRRRTGRRTVPCASARGATRARPTSSR